jgi:hypothetical protein
MIDPLKSVFAAMPASQKARALAKLAYGLTICTRGAYPRGGGQEGSWERARALNEIQHRVMAQLQSLLEPGDAAFPDDVFVDVLFDFAKSGDGQGDLAWAFEMAIREVT